MKVLLVPNHSREDAIAGARELEAWLEGEGVEVAWAHDKRLFPNLRTSAEGCDLVVSLGGDGTLLRAAKIVGYSEIPIVGISYGHLGFLTTSAPDGLIATVGAALAGELHVSRRATLAVTADFERADGSAYTLESFALNDLAISRGGQGAVIEFDISVSGHHIDRLRGDGFIVSTATGSTGYALAAGGPSVTPEFTGMVCVPVAPHTIMARAFLTSPSDVVEISMSPDRPVKRHFFADGQPLGEENGNEGFEGMRVMVRRGPGDILLLDHSAQSFYQSVSRVFYGKTGGK